MDPLAASLGGFQQVGMIVTDLDRTMKYMVDALGVGPFFVLREIRLGAFRYGGGPAAAPVVSVGLAQAGPVQIEIIQQHNDTPSVFRDFIASGREGCQHLALWFDNTEDYDRAYARLLIAGLRVGQESGTLEFSRNAYFVSDLPGALMIELSEQRRPTARALGDAVTAAAQGWKGADPIREWKSLMPSLAARDKAGAYTPERIEKVVE